MKHCMILSGLCCTQSKDQLFLCECMTDAKKNRKVRENYSTSMSNGTY